MAGQVTATGCLQRGSATASSGAAASTGAPGGGFVLKNAKMGDSGGSASGAGSASGSVWRGTGPPTRRGRPVR